MAKTKIQWCERVWNPIVGCSVVSPGCTNCYAMRQAARLLDKPGSHYEGTTQVVNGKPVWTGKVALAPEHILTAPLHWRKPSLVFVNSMGDLFHEAVPWAWIDIGMAVMALCPDHTFQVLTKRPEVAAKYMADQSLSRCDGRGEAVIELAHLHHPDPDALNLESFPWPLTNLWLGTSVEDRAHKSRIDELRATPAAIRFLSIEPLLEDIGQLDLTGIHWVIIGGESGPGARPFHLSWARSIIAQCKAAGVPCFYKQGGASNACAHDRKGGHFECFPRDLQVREFPNV